MLILCHVFLSFSNLQINTQAASDSQGTGACLQCPSGSHTSNSTGHMYYYLLAFWKWVISSNRNVYLKWNRRHVLLVLSCQYVPMWVFFIIFFFPLFSQCYIHSTFWAQFTVSLLTNWPCLIRPKIHSNDLDVLCKWMNFLWINIYYIVFIVLNILLSWKWLCFVFKRHKFPVCISTTCGVFPHWRADDWGFAHIWQPTVKIFHSHTDCRLFWLLQSDIYLMMQTKTLIAVGDSKECIAEEAKLCI